MTTEKGKIRKRVMGIVASDKMDKTISVDVERIVQTPKYHKYVKRATRLHADDPREEAGVGDLVELEFTRPLSKTKQWRLVRIVRRAREGAQPLPTEVLAPQPQAQPGS